MAEECRPDRVGDKADGVNGESLQRADQRVGSPEIQSREDEPGHLPVEQEIVCLDYRSDRLPIKKLNRSAPSAATLARDSPSRTILSPFRAMLCWTPERRNQKRKIPVAEPPVRCWPARLLSSAPEPVAFSAQ